MWLSIFLLFPLSILADNIQYYEGPSDKSDVTFQDWWQTFSSARDEVYSSLDLAMYQVEEVKWARTSFIQPQVNQSIEYLLSSYEQVDKMRTLPLWSFKCYSCL